ncbi:MAG TPA: arginine--tRNA ligase [Candidatus Binataceae bacterium]|nr:arginine--tRNA ligase [Candidatus Binataceae bacterium]
MKQHIIALIEASITRAHGAGQLKSSTAAFTVDAPKDPAHGDFATNAAMVLARAEGKPPRALAEIIKSNLDPGSDIAEITIAGPGFINFRMAPQFWHRELHRAALEGERYWLPQFGGGKKVDVEFLSANPTGPLTVGHGRNAVVGDTVARLLEATGHRVTREYYFNNGGRQMRLLGESVRARYFQECGREASLPEDGYQGEYISEIARRLFEHHGNSLLDTTELEPFRAAAEETIFADIRATCARLGIKFDVFTNELDFLRGGQVEKVIEGLREKDLIAEYDGAVWLKGEPLGLPKDQVLIRSGPDKQPTYRTPDIAYHIDKVARGFDLIIDVFGADHIAEYQGVMAAVKALGHDISRIRVIIYQFVTLTRGGEKVKMSTRKATYVTLDELIEEVGVDVVRFFFLFRKSDTHLDFDLDLAKRQAPENPVFYVQYAHARLASVFREAEKAGMQLPTDLTAINLALLSTEELDLAKRLLELPEVVRGSVEALEPHRVPFYLLELAGEFHRYYNKPTNRIIGSDPELSRARLFLAGLIKQGIAAGLGLLGVSAPERM